MTDVVHGVVLSAVRDGGAVLRLAGDLDATAVDRLGALLDDLAVPGARLRVELSRAGSLPLAVLRTLAAAHRRVADGALVLVDPSPPAARSLRTSGLHRALTVTGWPERPPAIGADAPELAG